MTSAFAWKLVLAVALVAAILVSALARAPRRPVPQTDLRTLVAAALLLYTVGLAAALSHRATLAALVYCWGIGTSALAVWLSRAGGRDDPPRGERAMPEPVPPDPDRIDWAALERQFRRPDRGRRREPVA